MKKVLLTLCLLLLPIVATATEYEFWILEPWNAESLLSVRTDSGEWFSIRLHNYGNGLLHCCPMTSQSVTLNDAQFAAMTTTRVSGHTQELGVEVLGPFGDGSYLAVTSDRAAYSSFGDDPRSVADLSNVAEQVAAQGGFNYGGDFGDPGVGGY